MKSNQGSNETGLMGKSEVQVGGNKASAIADLAENSWDQLKREEKEMEVRQNRFILHNITELKSSFGHE